MKNRIKASFAVIFTFLLCINLFIASSSAQNLPQAIVGITERVSIANDGRQANGYSNGPSISADGRYVAFSSSASNLVVGDTNDNCDTDGNMTFYENCPDIFVHDRVTGETTRVSVTSHGAEGNRESAGPSISADGRYVAFYSFANNLVEGDTNGYDDIFVHDRETGRTTRVSISSSGAEANFPSGYYGLSISADGRYVAFPSWASNLVVLDTNEHSDIFVHDRVTGETTRVSISSNGIQGNWDSFNPTISTDGQYVLFDSGSSNLVVGDTNGASDVFVHDRLNGVTTRISVTSDGSQGNSGSSFPSVSADGRYVAFSSWASNLVVWDTNEHSDIFVHDRVTGETTRVSISSNGIQGNWDSSNPTISADGRYVSFESPANNLVIGDTNVSSDIYVHDRVTSETTRVSVSSGGMQGNDGSQTPSISADGRYVAFSSQSTNLVVGDDNLCWFYRYLYSCTDIFVHDREGLAVGYSVSGHVTDTDGNPLPGVSISAGYGYSAITASQGDYTITGLLSGTYRIAPYLSGYYLSPMYRETSMPPARAGINFIEVFPTFLPIIGR